MINDDAEACKLTPCGNPLTAANGRLQASAPLLGEACTSKPASRVAVCVARQGVGPTESAGPVGDPVATALPSRDGPVQPCAPSFLDTLDITRRQHERSARHLAYVAALEEPTRRHRTAKAQRMRQLGRQRRARLRNSGASEAEVAERSRWYEGRAHGEEARIALVLECGAEVLIIACQDCGAQHERAQRCRARRYCVHCRGTIAVEMRARFLAARADVIREAQTAGLMKAYRKGGPYGDKFVTLTVPHLPTDTIASRMERLFKAWSQFLKWLNEYFDERTIRRVEWLRVVEWTPGESDDAGHPHIHVWIFAPYLPRAALQDLWRRALLKAGCPPAACLEPIIDIRAMTDPRDGAQELIKYLTKDINANGEKLSPALYAQVIEALDQHRQSQGSKGFMGRADKEPRRCNECNSPIPKRVRRKPRTPPHQA